MENYPVAGLDIGGTKCAAVLGEYSEAGAIRVLKKEQIATVEFSEPMECLKTLGKQLNRLIAESGIPKKQIRGVGISCGGPLDSHLGLILSPPNLPGWNKIPAVKLIETQTGLPVRLENDANACALAEWKFGAGRGTSNMIFLTFGTGLGAGIIANGKLLTGHSGMAGECGHFRLARTGPIGYGKAGSFEGFCSGGGIADMGRSRAEAACKSGHPLSWCPTGDLSKINAKIIAEAACKGDSDACSIYEESGSRLGEGLSLLIDLLNPERIVIGSIFARSEKLLRPSMERVIERETLSCSRRGCQIVPAQLGEQIGDIACLSIAAHSC